MPTQSWVNSAKYIILMVNVVLERSPIPDDFESLVEKSHQWQRYEL